MGFGAFSEFNKLKEEIKYLDTQKKKKDMDEEKIISNVLDYNTPKLINKIQSLMDAR